MKSILKAAIAFLVLTTSNLLFAGQVEFCVGFKQGYKSIKGDTVTVPACPVAPITSANTTDFQEGLKAGIRAAGS